MSAGGGTGRPPLRSMLASAVAGQLRMANRLSTLVWEQQMAGWSAFAAALDDRGRAQAQAPPPTSRAIRLDVAHGQRVSIPFLVQNRYERCVDVTFAADPLTPAAGAPVPAVIAFEPPTLALPPGGQLVVRAIVAITDDFADGHVYTTAVHVRDLPAPPLPVELSVGGPAFDARSARP